MAVFIKEMNVAERFRGIRCDLCVYSEELLQTGSVIETQ